MKPVTRNAQLATNKGVITSASFLLILTLFVFHPLPAFSQVDTTITPESEAALDEELRWLKAETYVITPSRIPEKIKKTASSITVITDRQIRQMGARNLTDVLVRAVPGISAIRNPMSWNIELRGRTNMASNTILFMINSHPINEAYSGGATMVHDTLIVDNIERIEVLRSPGSAVYGANAFLGVVNIITKKAEDVDGLELTARGGKWDAQQYNLLYGKAFNEVEVAFNFNYFKTHGFRGVVEEDQQTQIDQLWNSFGVPSNASLAPGRMAGDREKYDVALNLKYKGFQFDGRYVDKEWDLPIGFASALNHKSIPSTKDYYFNLSYGANVVEGLDFLGKVYRNVLDFDYDYQLFPPGYVTQTPFPLRPIVSMRDGLRQGGSLKDSRTGIEIQATYEITDSNTAVTGATYEEQKHYDISARANALPTLDPNVVIPLPRVIEYPDELTPDSRKRNLKAFFLEDIWDITDALRLTLGVRYDRYSDFGDEVSPRFGLTWEFIEGYDLKLLYGHAFRAPTFAEIELGKEGIELDPETIDTYEISLGAEFTSSLSSRVTFYYREVEDAITWTLGAYPWDWANSPETWRDHGVDIEVEYNFGRGTYLAGHYNYQSFNGWATFHTGSIMSNIRLSRHLNLYADCRFVDGRERQVVLPGEDRDDPSGYAIVNATLIAKKFLRGYEGFELRGSVYNLLDKDYTAPTGPEVPNDWPMPGRNFIIELKYKF